MDYLQKMGLQDRFMIKTVQDCDDFGRPGAQELRQTFCVACTILRPWAIYYRMPRTKIYLSDTPEREVAIQTWHERLDC